MQMILTLKKPYLSIVALPRTSLPAFTLLTGLNGTGKTHLLKAIEAGSVALDIAPSHKEDIRYFDWTTLAPKGGGQAHSTALHEKKNQLWNWLESAKSANYPALLQLISTLPPGDNEDPVCHWDLLDKSLLELQRLTGNERNANVIYEKAKKLAAKVWGHSQPGERRLQKEMLKEIAEVLGKTWITLTRQDLEHHLFVWDNVDLFQHSFARMFLAYFEAEKLNRLHRLDFDKGNRAVRPLSAAEFRHVYGHPPWEFANRTFIQAGLDFQIDHPESYTTTSYQPRLTKISSGADVQFDSLSSGEKVVMSFALCLYYSLDKREFVKKPKVLLLDEIDAPLHPSMCRLVVNTIIETLVKDSGVHVIMATHSPSTVAVAPEECIYAMRPQEQGVHKVSKRQAIALLTADIPTLSISFDGRRQVFVESDSDAKRYELIYKQVAPLIESERSLSFIGVGRRRTSEPDANAGCTQVRKFVEALCETGNVSVLGLVDWDHVHKPTPRVHVLACGERYSLENCLFDPLLLAALAVRERREFGREIGLGPTETVADLNTLPMERLQEVVNQVQLRILETTEIRYHRKVPYLGGFELLVSQDYLHLNGHELGRRVLDRIPHLNRFHRDGSLFTEIIDPIMIEFPRFVPNVLLRAFEDLLNAEIE